MFTLLDGSIILFYFHSLDQGMQTSKDRDDTKQTPQRHNNGHSTTAAGM